MAMSTPERGGDEGGRGVSAGPDERAEADGDQDDADEESERGHGHCWL